MSCNCDELRKALEDVIRASDENSGYEPSLSVFHRAIDNARAALANNEAKEVEYRMLEEGELIQEGDQFFDADGQWRHATGIQPNEVYKRSYKLHRRPIRKETR